MSYPPPHGPPPPPYYGPPHWPPPPMSGYPPPPHHPPHHPPHIYPPPPDHGYPPSQYPQPYYVPGTMMVPVPVAPAQPQDPGNATYITNYIYHNDNQNTPSSVPAIVDEVRVVEDSGEHEWIPTTATMASQLTGRAVVGGHEVWDGSPLWVIRAWNAGDLIPGKLSIRHNFATIVYDGKEIPVQNIEVLCSKSESLRWVPASSGTVPPGAIPGGRTSSGETLYVGRARYLPSYFVPVSVTPGKVHPSHNSCYIGFAGNEVAHKMYDVLCRAS